VRLNPHCVFSFLSSRSGGETKELKVTKLLPLLSGLLSRLSIES
jgi:hypothetical protein